MDPGTSPKEPASPFRSSHYREFAFTLVGAPRVVFRRTFRFTCHEPIDAFCCAGVLVDVTLEGKAINREMPGAPKRLACYARSRACETGDFTNASAEGRVVCRGLGRRARKPESVPATSASLDRSISGF